MQNYTVCPYCSEMLESGWLQSRDGLNWTPRKVFAAALSGLSGGAVRLENRKNQNNTAAHAYHCPKCKVVIVPYQRFDLDE